MKKIFSLSLMAVALLISGNAKAATLTVGPSGSYLTLESAFSAANSGDVIKLVGDVTVGSSIEINGKSLTLDMNGFNAEMNTVPTDGMKKPWMFVIFKGSLEVTGQGQILNSIPTTYKTSGKPTYTDGTTEILTFKLFGSHNNIANVTYLKIGKDVEVVANPGKAGINIDELNPIGSEKYKAIYGEDWNSNYRYMAYGVVVDIYGKVNGQKYGVQISGNLSKMENTPEAKANWPKVNIKPGSEVWSQPEEEESVGFYAAGQGNSMVEGTVHASTGVYVKGGDVEIHDAYVYSDNSNYEVPEGKKSGVDACGSAVVVDSKTGYAGAQNVTISGDTKLEGAGGYAIEEVITDPEGQTKVSSVTVEGGIIEGGDKGAMSFTTQTATGDENSKVTVYDGSFEGNTTIGDDEQDQLDVLLPVNEDKHITIVDGMMVVSDGAAPEPATKDINELTENTDIQYTDAREMTLTKDLTFKVVELIGAETLTIPEGKTLKADKLVLGADAQVVVEVGAKLLIMGNAGVVSKYPDNLVLKANADGMGILVFNPNVQSNRSPKATVELYTLASSIDATQGTWTMFVSPFAKITSLKSNMKDITKQGTRTGKSYFKYYNGSAWVNYNNLADVYANAAPFAAFAISNDADRNNVKVLDEDGDEVGIGGGVTYTFEGELQGNISGKFELKKGFNYLGNGFAAKMNAQAIINALAGQNENVRTLLYLWDEQAQSYVVYPRTKLAELGDLKATEMFVLYADDDATVDLDYEALIWNNNK